MADEENPPLGERAESEADAPPATDAEESTPPEVPEGGEEQAPAEDEASPEPKPEEEPEVIPATDETNEAGEDVKKEEDTVEEIKKETVEEKEPVDKTVQIEKDKKIQRLFDSKGSLLETESFVKEKLDDFKKKRSAVADMIRDLQAKVKEYKEKENPTDDDIANLKKYHAAFLEKLSEFEDMTRNVERLMGLADVPTSQLDMTISGPQFTKPKEQAPPTPPAKPAPPPALDNSFEDKLPKLIVCGTDMGDNVPRIIVCEPLKRADLEPFHKSDGTPGGGAGMMDKLNECFQTQQKLTAENAEMAKMRHQLQQELLDKQEILDCLKQKVMGLESEKYRIQSENKELQNRLMQNQGRSGSPMCKRELYMNLRGTLPDSSTEMSCPFTAAATSPNNLEQDLKKMGGDVKNIYSELECMQKEKCALGYSTSPRKPTFFDRLDNDEKNKDDEGIKKTPSETDIKGKADGDSPSMKKAVMKQREEELTKKEFDMKNFYPEGECKLEMLKSGYSSPRKPPVCKRMLPQKSTQTDEDKERDILFATDKDPKLKDLKEQYKRLHSDFKNKVTEVATLRVDMEKTKQELEAITVIHHELEAMHQREVDQNNALKADIHQIQSYKDKITDLEQQANLAKQMYKTGQEEIEEMRSLIEEQATQLDDYRNKYMKTLQIAEELRKENEFKERECADHIAVEIQRVKLEMQEQLEELSPIKDLLKITQQKLKETEQMHTIALETIGDITKKLENANNEIDEMKKKVDSAKKGDDVTMNLANSLEAADKKLKAMENDNSNLKGVVSKLEAQQVSQGQKLEEKSHELMQMTTQLETLREESARQVTRVKERSDMIRKCLQAQIAEMEREVASCRAATSFANRERDEIRSKLQMEVCLLSENFRDSQNRIVQMQQHVNYLSASHPTALIDLVK